MDPCACASAAAWVETLSNQKIRGLGFGIQGFKRCGFGVAGFRV